MILILFTISQLTHVLYRECFNYRASKGVCEVVKLSSQSSFGHLLLQKVRSFVSVDYQGTGVFFNDYSLLQPNEKDIEVADLWKHHGKTVRSPSPHNAFKRWRIKSNLKRAESKSGVNGSNMAIHSKEQRAEDDMSLLKFLAIVSSSIIIMYITVFHYSHCITYENIVLFSNGDFHDVSNSCSMSSVKLNGNFNLNKL